MYKQNVYVLIMITKNHQQNKVNQFHDLVLNLKNAIVELNAMGIVINIMW